MTVLLFCFLLWSIHPVAIFATILDVGDFGARGDGTTDDTRAFQEALHSLAGSGGIVRVPSGRYLIAGNLDIPAGVTLEGMSRNGPPRSLTGSVLLPVSGRGETDGPPFIMLNRDSTLCGLVIFYPEQITTDVPVPYPWTLRGHGDNITVKNCLLVNPYQAVDFGSFPCGRHRVEGLYGRPLYRGIYIDKCYDVGRVRDVHFWPFWESESLQLRKFQEEQGIAFVVGRTDWQYMSGCFCLWYKEGYRFTRSPEPGTGSGNAVLTNCGSDMGEVALRVLEVQNHAGLSLVNCQLMGTVILEDTNHGPVKFTACGFWGVADTGTLVMNRSSGRTSFVNCQFFWWDRAGLGAPAILSENGDLTVTGCEFGEPGKTGIYISRRARSALVTANTLRTRKGIFNKAGRRARIKNNIYSFRPGGSGRPPTREQVKKWLRDRER